MSQEEVLELLEKKDKKAYNVLYDMYAKSLYAVIADIVKDEEVAKDLLQDVFVKIWKNLDSFDSSKGRLYTWIINIARNAAKDVLRSKTHRNSQKNLSAENFVHLQDESNQPTNRIDFIGIQEFIKKLKPKCIQIIDLLFFKGYTQQEASDELQIPLGTVKTQNRSCINDLRKFLNV
jgi:RNA polymerase sigma-70 factor, ECF subfamily